MKYLKTFESYSLSCDTELILENKKIMFYKTIHNKTINKLGLNLYFVGTYTMGVAILYPIIEALINNSNIPDIIPEKVVLMTLFCIAQILHISNDEINKIKDELETNNLMEVTKKVKKSILSIYKIFSFVSKSFGKIIDVFTDMLAYVSLGVPVCLAITELVSKDGLNLDTLPQKVLVFGGGIAFFAFKSIVETIIIMLKNKFNYNGKTKNIL